MYGKKAVSTGMHAGIYLFGVEYINKTTRMDNTIIEG
jgi:hypothetical protein